MEKQTDDYGLTLLEKLQLESMEGAFESYADSINEDIDYAAEAEYYADLKVIDYQLEKWESEHEN